jgi:hypothetical protein
VNLPLQSILVASTLLSGCVTYEDVRPLPEQKSQLLAAASELVGDYWVLDSRNWHEDLEGKAIYAKVSASNDGISAKILSDKTLVTLQTDKTCRGSFDEDSRHDIRIYCHGLAKTIYSGYDMKKIGNVRDINGPLIGGFKPLRLSPGDYLLGFYTRDGRPHYFVLKRR